MANDHSFPIPGFIYVLIEREFVRSGENVVKVGRTRNMMKRLNQYPKGSKLLFCMYCDTLVSTETELLRLLDTAFVRRSDMGRERFQGDINAIVSFVNSFVNLKLLTGRPVCPAALDGPSSCNNGDVEEKDNDETGDVGATDASSGNEIPDGTVVIEEGTVVIPEEPVVIPKEAVALIPKEMVVPDVAVVRFVEEHKIDLDGAKELSARLYDRFASFCDSTKWKVPVNHVKFSKLLCEIYKAQSVVVRDGLNVERYIQMPRFTRDEDASDNNAVDGVGQQTFTNKLHEFLAMDDDERGYRITRVEGHVTWELDFQSAFQTVLSGTKYVADATVFGQFGFTKGAKAEYACLGCKQLAKARGGKCCEVYSHSNRRQKVMIYNMRLEKMDDKRPQLEFVCEVIDRMIDFSPPPRTAEDGLRGRKVTCYVERSRILDAIIRADATGITNNVKKGTLKTMIDEAMVARARPLKPHTYVGGEQLTNVYNNCSWRGD